MKRYFLKTIAALVIGYPISILAIFFEAGRIYGDYRDFLIILVIDLIVVPLLSLYELKPFRYNFEEIKNDIETIEIVKLYKGSEKDYERVIALIESENSDKFLLNLSKLNFKHGLSLFGDKSPIGICVKLTYKNQSCEYVNGKMSEKFDHEDKRIFLGVRHCSDKDFKNLISNFIKHDSI